MRANIVDASYTGDLLDAAGVAHRLGMADLLQHDERTAVRRGGVEALRVPRDEVRAATEAFGAHPFVRVEDDLPPFRHAAGAGRAGLSPAAVWIRLVSGGGSPSSSPPRSRPASG